MLANKICIDLLTNIYQKHKYFGETFQSTTGRVFIILEMFGWRAPPKYKYF